MKKTTLLKIKDQGKLILSKKTKTVYTKQTIEGKHRQNKMVVITADQSGYTYRLTAGTQCWPFIFIVNKSTGSTVAKKRTC